MVLDKETVCFLDKKTLIKLIIEQSALINLFLHKSTMTEALKFARKPQPIYPYVIHAGFK